MTEINTSIALQFYNEVVNKGDIEIMDQIMDQNFVDHNAAPVFKNGIDGFKQFLVMLSNAFPDIRVEVEDLISKNNNVVARLTISGTQTGVLMGNIQPGGKHAVWSGIDILTIENGKITERWSQRDLLGMMKQIGAINNS